MSCRGEGEAYGRSVSVEVLPVLEVRVSDGELSTAQDGLVSPTIDNFFTNRDALESSAMRLAGTRVRLMDRPMQKVDARGVGSQVLYAVPDYLHKQGAQVQLWKKESSGRFSLVASL